MSKQNRFIVLLIIGAVLLLAINGVVSGAEANFLSSVALSAVGVAIIIFCVALFIANPKRQRIKERKIERSEASSGTQWVADNRILKKRFQSPPSKKDIDDVVH